MLFAGGGSVVWGKEEGVSLLVVLLMRGKICK